MKFLHKHRKGLMIAAHCSYFIVLAGMTTAIIILQVHINKVQLERIAGLETELAEMKQEIAEKHEEIEQQIESGIELTGERIRGTNYRIQRIEAVYAELLEAQYRRTLDSLYTESELLEKKQEAARLFQEGKYAAAREQYAAISRARPEDVEARFYQWYSLFLSNKMDMSNYQQIKEGLRGLEQAGYHRAEIKEILGYITTEEGGQ